MVNLSVGILGIYPGQKRSITYYMVESESMQPPYLTLIELATDGMPVMKNRAPWTTNTIYGGRQPIT